MLVHASLSPLHALEVGTGVPFPSVPLLSKVLEKVRQDAVWARQLHGLDLNLPIQSSITLLLLPSIIFMKTYESYTLSIASQAASRLSV